MEEATKRSMDANDEDATKQSDGREREDADDDATDEKMTTIETPRDAANPRARRRDLGDAASEDARYRTVFVEVCITSVMRNDFGNSLKSARGGGERQDDLRQNDGARARGTGS